MTALPPLKEGFTSRPATLADLAAIVDVANDSFEVAFGMRKFTIADMQAAFTTPGFDLPASSVLVLSPEGRVVGTMIVFDLASPPVHPELNGAVLPAYEGQGIGTFLLAWGEERARQSLPRVPDELRVSAYQGISSTYAPTRQLLERCGWQAIRYSWLMLIEFQEPPAAPAWPAGIVVRTFQDLPDVRAVYRAANEAFRDHWGHVDQPEEVALERWQHRIQVDPEFDPTVWFLAMDGSEIAGVSLCRTSWPTDPAMGFVNTLGVRRPWRRLGLGLALLQHSFVELHRRGRKRVGLGVDASSLTGATRLYEKAGMRAVQQMVMYEEELRPGQELARQSLEAQ
jgi:mycothiol synthase